MIRLSVTDLETLRYHKTNEDATLDDLLRKLAHVEPATRKMDAGKALAKFWETAEYDGGVIDSALCEGWRFNFNLPEYTEIQIPIMREMKVECPLLTPSGLVVLVGKVDGFHGLVVRDQKLTDNLDVEERYCDSLQWRAYLSMLKARKFVYDIFVGRVNDTEDVVTLTEYHPVTFYTYPDIERDVMRAVFELASIVSRYADRIEDIKRGAQGVATP